MAIIPTVNTEYTNGAVHPLDMVVAQMRYDDDNAYADMIQLRRNYYDGTQDTHPDEWLEKRLEVNGVKFRLNINKTATDLMSERMILNGFTASGDGDKKENQVGGKDGILNDWWTKNKMGAVQIAVTKTMARDGDSYIVMGWDEENQIPTMRHETAWDGTQGMTVVYDPEDRTQILYAIQRWSTPDKKTQYMTVYTDSTVEKYIAMSGVNAWQEYAPEDGEWPARWESPRTGEPRGIAVIHFSNNNDGSGYGVSELDDTMPTQNERDLYAWDEARVSGQHGKPTIWITGGNGGDGSYDMSEILAIPGMDVRVGSIPAANLAPLSDLIATTTARAAEVSRTPHIFYRDSGQVSSAASIKAGEVPFVSKITGRSVAIGDAWERVMYAALRIYADEAKKPIAYDAGIISAEWASFETVDSLAEERERTEIAEKKMLVYTGLLNALVPPYLAAIQAGYTEEVATEMAQSQPAIRADGTY